MVLLFLSAFACLMPRASAGPAVQNSSLTVRGNLASTGSLTMGRGASITSGSTTLSVASSGVHVNTTVTMNVVKPTTITMSGSNAIRINTRSVLIDKTVNDLGNYSGSLDNAATTLTVKNSGLWYGPFGGSQQPPVNTILGGGLTLSLPDSQASTYIRSSGNTTGRVNLGGISTNVGGVSIGSSNSGVGMMLGTVNRTYNSTDYVLGDNNNSTAPLYLGNGKMTMGYSIYNAGAASFVAGISHYNTGYGAAIVSDRTTNTALTGYWLGGGHNRNFGKGSSAGKAGDLAADSGGIGGTNNIQQANCGVMLGSDSGLNFSDYGGAQGYRPMLSKAHAGSIVFKGRYGDTTTDTTQADSFLIFPDHGSTATLFKVGGNSTIQGTTFSGSGASLTGLTTAIVSESGNRYFTSARAVSATSTTYQALDSDLTALGNNSTNGLWARTGSGTGAARTITGTGSNITLTNGDAVSGNPTIDVGSNIPKLASANAFTAAQTITLTGGAGLTLNGGNYPSIFLDNTAGTALGGLIKFRKSSVDKWGVGTDAVGSGGEDFWVYNYTNSKALINGDADGLLRFGALSGGTNYATNHLYDTSGARLTAGGTWTNASSASYKFDDGQLTPSLATIILGNLDVRVYDYKVQAERIQMKDGRLLTRPQARAEWRIGNADDGKSTATERFAKWITTNTSGPLNVRINQRSGERHIGLMAEDWQRVTRQAGLRIADGESISALDVAALAIAAIQEQQREIVALKARVAALEEKSK